MKRILIFLVNLLVKPVVARYTSKTTHYTYDGVRIVVFPGVFHPRFFFSTKLLLSTLKKTDLREKRFLELGAGSGLISVFAAKNGARVTASDISSVAVKNILENRQRNGVAITVLHSDLFQAIPVEAFDTIVINPPYYKKNPVSESDHAWYCGENGEYFGKLFASLHAYLKPESNVIMVLADVCDIDLITSMAMQKGFRLKCLSSHDYLLEKNFIFQVIQNP